MKKLVSFMKFCAWSATCFMIGLFVGVIIGHRLMVEYGNSHILPFVEQIVK